MNGPLKPITIKIREAGEVTLPDYWIKYIWKTLINMAGFQCHFVAQNYRGEVDIEYGPPSSNRCLLSVKKQTGIHPGTVKPISIARDGGILFVQWPGDVSKHNVIVRKKDSILLDNDIVLTCYYFLSGNHDGTIPRDKLDNQLVEESFLYRQRILHIPFINKYASFLTCVFNDRNALPIWPNGKKYSIVLTHDVDYPEINRWVETIRLFAKPNRQTPGKARRVLTGKTDFWCFDRWMEIESTAGARSAFFFSGYQGSLLRYFLKAPDPFYDVEKDKYKRLFRNLTEAGFEVGLHSSYNAFRSENLFAAEKARLESALGNPVLSNRHHYWHTDPEGFYRTAETHSRLGFLCDASLAFERRCGFRYGIAAPFQLFNPDSKGIIPVVELPTSLMDDQLFGYRRLGYLGGPAEEIDELLKQAKEHRGMLVVDYHGRVYNETIFPGWRDTYEYLLGRASGDSDCWIATPSEVARHYLNRQASLDRYFRDDYR